MGIGNGRRLIHGREPCAVAISAFDSGWLAIEHPRLGLVVLATSPEVVVDEHLAAANVAGRLFKVQHGLVLAFC